MIDCLAMIALGLAGSTPGSDARAQAIRMLVDKGVTVLYSKERPTRVQEIHADQCKLTDDDMGRFSAMPEVQAIGVHNARITDEGIAKLAGLKEINFLAITDCPSLTDKSLMSIGRLTTLQTLCLRDAKVSDIGLVQVAGLRELQNLTLSGSGIGDEGIAHLSELPKLTTLRLDGTSVSGRTLGKLKSKGILREVFLRYSLTDQIDLAALVTFTSLEVLDLEKSKCSESELRHIAKCDRLRELNLSRTSVKGGFEALTTLQKLEQLHLSNLHVSDRELHTLPYLESLSYLSLANTRVGDDCIVAIVKQLPKLETLSLIGSSVSDVGILQLREIKTLRRVFVKNTKTTLAGLKALKQARPDLSVYVDGLKEVQ